jgi:homocitrate synthase
MAAEFNFVETSDEPSGIQKVEILDTTLREGEQFSGAFLTPEQRIELVKLLDAFGVDYIEVPSPVVSPRAKQDIQAIVALRLRAKVVAHTRCVMEDVQAAVEAGVDGINLYYGTSPHLREYSHGRRIEDIIDAAIKAIRYVKDQGLIVRFSAEDAFRTDFSDLITVFDAIDAEGVNRMGMPDTVGIATPMEVFRRASICRQRYQANLEFHGHNDTGCAIANSLTFLEAGGSCINTTILGIGERNGITSMSGLVAGIYATDKRLLDHYTLSYLTKIDQALAGILDFDIPFNNPITSPTAFTHRAGVHTNAMIRNSSAYEILNPDDFGVSRKLDISSRFTGRNAIRMRAKELGVELDDNELRLLTSAIKEAAEKEQMNLQGIDTLIIKFGENNGDSGRRNLQLQIG